MAELQDRVALVVGGANGMGLASCRALAADGATVIIADLDGAAAEIAASDIRETGGQASHYRVDASSLAGMKALIDFVDRTFGRLNVLFLNVGAKGADGFEISEAEFDAAIDLNLKVHYFTTNYAVPLLKKGAPKASIIYMSSGAGLRFFGRSPMYSISKAANLMMMRTFARHLGPEGIRANALCPGHVDTAFARIGRDDASYQAAIEAGNKTIPLGRIAQPEDVADLVSFLASDRSAYLTGLSIPVDGGVLA